MRVRHAHSSMTFSTGNSMKGKDNVVHTLIWTFVKDDRGATAIEYGLIAALIAVIIIAAVSTVGKNLSTTFSSVAGSL